MVSVRAGVETDRAAVIGVLLRGFEADPWSRWWFPSDEAWSERAPEFFGLGFDVRMEDGGEVFVSEPMASVLCGRLRAAIGAAKSGCAAI
jgi:hypothetical protein